MLHTNGQHVQIVGTPSRDDPRSHPILAQRWREHAGEILSEVEGPCEQKLGSRTCKLSRLAGVRSEATGARWRNPERSRRTWENVAAELISRILSAGLLQQDGHSSGPRIAVRLKRPTRRLWRAEPTRPQANPRSLPIWSCSVWGLPCPPHYCGSGALLPHLFTLTWHPLESRLEAVCFLWHFPSSGLESTLPDVIRHTALRSSDFPPSPLDAARATVRSSCQHFIIFDGTPAYGGSGRGADDA